MAPAPSPVARPTTKPRIIPAVPRIFERRPAQAQKKQAPAEPQAAAALPEETADNGHPHQVSDVNSELPPSSSATLSSSSTTDPEVKQNGHINGSHETGTTPSEVSADLPDSCTVDDPSSPTEETPTATKATPVKAAPDRPASEDPALDNPASEKTASEKPALENPALDKPAPENSTLEKPASEKSASEKSALEKPAPATPAARKQLPPPFYPPNQTTTPPSGNSSQQANIGTPNSVMDRRSLNLNGIIVFGGQVDSESTTPAPLSAGAGTFVPGYPPPPAANGQGPGPGPGADPSSSHGRGHGHGHGHGHSHSHSHGHGFGPGSFGQPHQFHAHHGHHASDASQMMYPPMAMGPMGPPNGYGYARDHPHGHYGPPEYYLPSNNSPYAMYTPGAWMPPPPMHANGFHDARSAHGSSPDFDTEHSVNGALKNTGHHSNPSMQSNGMPGSMKHSRHSSQVDPGPTMPLHAHLLAQFDDPQLADVLLILLQNEPSSNDDQPIATFHLHSLAITRSGTLHRLIVEQAHDPATPKTIRLSVDEYVAAFPGAFSDVLRAIYGAPLIDFGGLKEGLPSVVAEEPAPEKNAALHKMNYIIAYLAACVRLEFPEAYRRAASVLADLLRWDNVEAALNFALDRPTKQLWSLSKKGPHGFVHQSPHTTGPFTPSMDMAREDVLTSVVNFICTAFPADFVLDTRTIPLAKVHRFPPMPEDCKSYTDPKVTKIQFGQMEPEQKNWVSTLLSRIFISIPQTTLDRIFRNHSLGGHLSWPKVAETMRAVVNERESRRARFLRSRNADAAIDFAKKVGLFDNLTQRELVVTSDEPCGIAIASSYDALKNHASKPALPILEIEDGVVKSVTF